MCRALPMILVRVIVGWVYLIEGALKLMLPEELDAGPFAALSLPIPDLLAPLAEGMEIVGGAAILLNIYAGDAALTLLTIIVTALVTTKTPILLGHPLGPFAPVKLPYYGWMSFFHEARADLCMTFSTLAVVIDSGLK